MVIVIVRSFSRPLSSWNECFGLPHTRLTQRGIIAWQKSRASNGLLEGTNSFIQAAKRRARGYRSKEKMITIVYLIAGKLPLPQIHMI